MTSFARGITYAFRPVQAVDPGVPLAPHPGAAGAPGWGIARPNSYSCPIGPTEGVGAVLMLRKDVPVSQSNVGKELTFWTEGDHQAVRVTFKNLFLLRATLISGGYATDPDGLMLVELVDRRWHLNRFSDINRQFNVTAPASQDYLLESTDSGTPYTWQGVIDELWTECGLPLPATSPITLPTSTPQNLKFVGVRAWHALHEVLARLGMTTAYSPFTDEFRLIAFSGAGQVTPSIEGEMEEYVGLPVQGLACRGPQTIRVYFHRHDQDTGQEDDTGVSGNAIATPAHSIDVPTNLPGALPNTVMPLWDSMVATIEHGRSSFTASHLADLQARAEERAAAWLDLHSRLWGLRTAEVYTGLVRRIPTIRFKRVTWRDWGPEFGGLVTEFSAEPGLPLNRDGGGACRGEDSWIHENWGPPQLTVERQPPSYPEKCQLVVLTDDEPSDASHNYYPAKVTRYISDTIGGDFTDYEDVWVKFAEATPTVSTGDRFVARLFGMGTDNANETRPLYVARGRGHAGTSWCKVWFKVTSSFTTSNAGFSAEVTRVFGDATLPSGGVESTDAISVVNPDSDTAYLFEGEEDFRGQAFWDALTNSWICEYVQC